jgi:hypothetical protein
MRLSTRVSECDNGSIEEGAMIVYMVRAGFYLTRTTHHFTDTRRILP